MKIEDIYTELERLGRRMDNKSKGARAVAKVAHRKGDIRKRDKFNAIARVYEMTYVDLMPLCNELLDHTPTDFQNNRDVPF